MNKCIQEKIYKLGIFKIKIKEDKHIWAYNKSSDIRECVRCKRKEIADIKGGKEFITWRLYNEKL